MNSQSLVRINTERMLADLRALARFGKLNTGVGRVSYSETDTRSREWLRECMTRAGLQTSIDYVGNLFGRTPGDRPAILIGSHTDTVPVGGWLDGALGVIYGLEIARAVMEGGLQDRICVEVVSFMDEEGTYLPCVGSLQFCEQIGPDKLAEGRSLAGETLLDAIARCGYADNPLRTVKSASYSAYLEAHIEQGPRLEAAEKQIGVVTGIVGIRRLRIAFDGEADHAGTVPMAMRRDAGRAAITCAHELYRAMERAGGEESVWNIGAVRFEPGAENVVPAKATLVLEFRDLSTDRLDAMEDSASEVIQQTSQQTGLDVSVLRTIDITPSAMDEKLAGHLAEAASHCGAESMMMSSGAGHDAMILSRCMPSAMMFIPSIRGKSHSEAEDTDEADIAFGCQVLANATERIALSM